MQKCFAISIAVSALAAFTACTTKRVDDSRVVSTSTGAHYYLLRPDSAMRQDLGYGFSPAENPDQPNNVVKSNNLLVFHLDKKNTLVGAPAYVTPGAQNPTYTARLSTLKPGVTTIYDLEKTFGAPIHKLETADGYMAYRELPNTPVDPAGTPERPILNFDGSTTPGLPTTAGAPTVL